MIIKENNSFAWESKLDLHMTLNKDVLISDVVPEPVNHLGLKKLISKQLSLDGYGLFPFL